MFSVNEEQKFSLKKSATFFVKKASKAYNI